MIPIIGRRNATTQYRKDTLSVLLPRASTHPATTPIPTTTCRAIKRAESAATRPGSPITTNGQLIGTICQGANSAKGGGSQRACTEIREGSQGTYRTKTSKPARASWNNLLPCALDTRVVGDRIAAGPARTNAGGIASNNRIE